VTIPHGDEAVLDELVERLRAERALFERVLLRLPDVTAGLDTDRIRDGITELAVDLCGADFGLLVAADEDESTGTWAGEPPAEAPSVWRAPLLAAAFRHGPVLRIDDVGRWARTDDAAAQYGSFAGGAMVRSYLVAPVVNRSGEVIAALFVGRRRAHAFGAHHERLLEAMVRALATALDNAERFHERDRVAAALQETLLPPLLPVVPGADLAARYRAAAPESQVGGDFYDVFRAGERWGAVIGDVCGTGPEAAAVTGVARYTIRALAATSSSPAATMVALNEALVLQRSERRFLTAVHLLFAVTAGIDVALARAGHPPPILLRADGSASLLDEPRGTLLGVFDDVSVDDGELHLGLGDALVMYTDGVVEARSPAKEQYGYERLLDLVSTCAGRTADGIARRIELAVADFAGGEITDDVAILVLRAT
jgi:serine phosphatase RsbU (regulator of sigma subunit)